MTPLVAIYRGEPEDGDLMCYVRDSASWFRFLDSAREDTHPYWALLYDQYKCVTLAGNQSEWR